MMKSKLKALILLAIVFSVSLSSSTLQGQNDKNRKIEKLPVIPIGLDAYRMWDHLPYHKIGIRAYMRSTYDREGNNRTADAGHFLYQESDSFNVTLDVKGQGFLYFKRTNHFHGSPWHYEIDGNNTIIKETGTDDPIDAKNKYKEVHFIPKDLFPNPLTFTWATTKGADLMWVPIGFTEQLRIAYSRTFYGTGYYIYHSIPFGTKHLSKPLRAWDKTPPAKDILELLGRAGTDIVGNKEGIKNYSGTINLSPRETANLLILKGGPKIIRSIKLKIPEKSDFDFGRSRLKITWDNNWHPSIDVPISLFFGAGELYNADNKEYLVKGFPLVIKYDGGKVFLDCYWPMPYFKNAVIELQERNGSTINEIEYTVSVEEFHGPKEHLNYFHATYTNIPDPERGEDNIFLDTRMVEGGGDWSGHFVGMSWTFSHKGVLPVLEGDPRFYFDDSNTPQAWGTGSEEWGGGGDYWGGENMTIPLAGHPIGKDYRRAKNEKDLINSAYRFLIADYFPFGKRAVIGLEHGGLNRMNEHMKGVTYWYGINSPSLILTDRINVNNDEDCERHNLISPSAEACYHLVSRYEKGPDQSIGETKWIEYAEPAGALMYYPAEEDMVRKMTGTTQFTVKTRKDNHGVLIRRKFDYSYPNQESKVYMRANENDHWKYVGNWYTAGSNTYVYSRPLGKPYTEEEFAPTEHNVITSNRRWREEEFAISSNFTNGLEQMEIKLEFVPNSKELYPGYPFPVSTAWSESRYWIYSWVLPAYDWLDE